MKDRLRKQAQKEYSERQRYVAFAFLAPIFIVLLPLALWWVSGSLDRRWGWPNFEASAIWVALGVLLILTGWGLAIWTIYVQFTLGKGTPVPVMATQKLIIVAPYSWCRNPMALGAIMAYSGVALLLRSWSALLLVAVGGTLLLLYIRFLEEREMVDRFGQEYLEYRRNTPFIFPRLK